jgi:hypothetical protein
MGERLTQEADADQTDGVVTGHWVGPSPPAVVPAQAGTQ